MIASNNNDRLREAGVSRRGFLRDLLATGSGLAAVAALGNAQAEAAAESSPTEASESRGYHETQHIRDYYRTAAL